MGATHIRLSKADRDVLAGALKTAWQLRVTKNAATRFPPRQAQSTAAALNGRLARVLARLSTEQIHRGGRDRRWSDQIRFWRLRRDSFRDRPAFGNVPIMRRRVRGPLCGVRSP